MKSIAKSEGLTCLTSYVFDPTLYPGYEHRRTLGFKSGVSIGDNEEIAYTKCRTFVFVYKSQADLEADAKLLNAKKKKTDEDDNDE